MINKFLSLNFAAKIFVFLFTFALLASTSLSPVFADGDDSPDACDDATYGSIKQGDDDGNQIDFTIPTANTTASGVCIKSGNGAFGTKKHSQLLTTDGTYGDFGCYTVSGLGTATVTVTRRIDNDCKDLSHIDVDAQMIPKFVSIDEQVLTCGAGERTISGTAFYQNETNDHLVVRLDGNQVFHNHDELTAWNFVTNLSTGPHTVEAWIYDTASFIFHTHSNQDAYDSWSFNVDSCPVDVCPNIPELQTEVPDNYYANDNGCFEKTPVCTDPEANNYDSEVDSSEYDGGENACTYDPEEIPGCMDESALNYSSEATVDDQSCEYPPEEPEDVCPNLDGAQESLPDGYHFEEGQCVQDPVEPTPTPGPGKETNLETTALSCDNRSFDAKIRLLDNGQPVQGIKVKFTYHWVTHEKVTDANGRAQVGFWYEGSEGLKVEPENGFPSHNRGIALPNNEVCPEIEFGIGGGDYVEPEVLAETGVLVDTLVKSLGALGGMLTLAGSALYAKKNA